MTFIEFDYLFLFLPLVVGLYYVFRTSWFANVIILAASYYFYGSSGLWLLIPLVFTSLLDFYVGLKISRTEQPYYRRLLLIVSLTANLGLLAVFKYTPWVIESANLLLAKAHIAYALPILAITLPPGISFYTFQTMSYTIEVYRREMKASGDIVSYMSFVTFWPHLVAGPIMRANVLLPQLEKIRQVISSDEARYALMLITWGLFKKLVLADNFGHIVNSIDGNLKGGSAWSGAGLLFAYAFAGQIYCDFSAYTDMARGSAKLIGVDLVRNFHTPYFSASPSEFWRRWHISLSTWLRDYLYFSLGGNRFGKFKEYRNLMVTMVLGGLWHGAGILFIAWGFWHGLLLVLYRIFPFDKFLTSYLGVVGKWISIVLTFHLICIGWIFFRAQPDTLWPIFSSIGDLFTDGSKQVFYIFGQGVLGLGLITLLTDYIGYRKNVEFPDLFIKLNPYACGAVAIACYFGITLLAKREGAQFIYFAF